MRLLATVLFLALSAPVAAAADDAKEAAKKLEGTYEVLDVTSGGKPDPKKDETKGVEIKDGQFNVKRRNKLDEAVKFTLDPTKKPAQIDFSPGGDDKIPGIYEVKETDTGTELTVAFADGPKGARPTDFKGAGKGEVVIKLFRKTAK